MIHMIPQLLVEMVPRKFLENADIATCMRLVFSPVWMRN